MGGNAFPTPPSSSSTMNMGTGAMGSVGARAGGMGNAMNMGAAGMGGMGDTASMQSMMKFAAQMQDACDLAMNGGGGAMAGVGGMNGGAGAMAGMMQMAAQMQAG